MNQLLIVYYVPVIGICFIFIISFILLDSPEMYILLSLFYMEET